MPNALPYLALFVTVLIWGSSAVFLKTLAMSLSATDAVVIRYVIVSAVFAAGFAFFGTLKIARADWPRFLFTATAGLLLYNLGINHGLALIPASAGGVITAVEPLLIVAGAAIVLREPLTAYTWAGLAFAFIGTVALFWRDLMTVEGSGISPAGTLYAFAGIAGWAIYTIAAKPLLQRYDAYTVTAVTTLLCTVPLLFMASPNAWSATLAMTSRQWFEMFYLVVFGTVLGTVFWNYGVGKLGGAAAGAFIYLIPVVIIASGALLLDEALTPEIVFGCAVILIGVALAEFGGRLITALGRA